MFSVKFWKAACVRAIRTAAEAALTYIGTAYMLNQVNWWGVLSSAAMGAVMSILLALATGLPEAKNDD